LYDILGRYSAGELNVKSLDYMSHGPKTHRWSIQYSVFPCSFSKDNKESGKQQIELLAWDQLIVLAVTCNHNTKFDFALRNKSSIFTILLPAFPGAKPYHSTFKEVKSLNH
jgi:formyltetrahydrofolate hydrolase